MEICVYIICAKWESLKMMQDNAEIANVELDIYL